MIVNKLHRLCISWIVLSLCLVFLPKDSSAEIKERVERAIGGDRVTYGQWPWLALLKGTIVTRRIFGIPISHRHLYCGATIISNRWLLTAAHCFGDRGEYARNTGMWEVRIGTTRLRASVGLRIVDAIGRAINRDELRQWEMDVSRVVIHPQYTRLGFINDIALIKLDRNIPSIDSIQPVPLPAASPRFPQPGQSCVVTGWGCTSENSGPSSRARQIEIPILENRYCQRHFGAAVNNGTICAGFTNQDVGICQGDSGGPLVCGTNAQYTLAGIAAFTSRENPGNYPGGFMHVQRYLPWINQIIN